jgi:hypothetical protein
MIRLAYRPALLVLMLALPILASTEAQAQFGSLKKKASSAALQAAGLPTKPPTYVKSTTMTAAQLQQLNAGLNAMIAKAPSAQKDYQAAAKRLEQQTADYQKALDEYHRKDSTYQACTQAATDRRMARHDSLSGRADQQVSALQMNESQEAQLKAQAQKAQEAAQRVANGTATAADRQTLADFQKMMGGVSARANEAAAAIHQVSTADSLEVARLEKECGGKPPAEPTPPPPAPSGPQDILRQAGAEAAGTNSNQFAMWLDDGDGYVESNTVAQPGGEMTDQQASDFNAALKETGPLIVKLKKTGVPY